MTHYQAWNQAHTLSVHLREISSGYIVEMIDGNTVRLRAKFNEFENAVWHYNVLAPVVENWN